MPSTHVAHTRSLPRPDSSGRLHCHVLTAFIWAALLFFAAPHRATAQESQAQETAELDRVGRWKVINFALFAIGLGYLIAKTAPGFFNARSTDIQKAIKDAMGLKIEADFRHSEIDRKMATLAEEVKRIRDEAAAHMHREHARVRQDTAEGIRRINQHVAAEVEALRQEGIRKVRHHTAQSALALAEQRLRERLAQSEPPELMQDLVQLIERGRN